MYAYLQKGKVEFVRALFNILFVFFTSYIVFVILPVAGGRIMENYYIAGYYIDGAYQPGILVESVRELTETYRHGLFTHIMVYIYRASTHFGGAFPSSHVAVSLTISLLSFRYFRGLAFLLLVVTFFLSISTVFCHYHYFVDAVAGVIWGVVMFGLSELVYAIIGVKKAKYIDDWK
jgi:membrane-associated phospholipid phosphatase